MRNITLTLINLSGNFALMMGFLRWVRFGAETNSDWIGATLGLAMILTIVVMFVWMHLVGWAAKRWWKVSAKSRTG